MRKTIEHCYCDRCGKEFDAKQGPIEPTYSVVLSECGTYHGKREVSWVDLCIGCRQYTDNLLTSLIDEAERLRDD